MEYFTKLIKELRGKAWFLATIMKDDINSGLMERAAESIEALSREFSGDSSSDIISLKYAFETDEWTGVFATRPKKKVYVHMTYDDLWRIISTMRTFAPLVDHICKDTNATDDAC